MARHAAMIDRKAPPEKMGILPLILLIWFPTSQLRPANQPQ